MNYADMDFSAADSNEYFHSDSNTQFKRERRKVGKRLLYSIYTNVTLFTNGIARQTA